MSRTPTAAPPELTDVTAFLPGTRLVDGWQADRDPGDRNATRAAGPLVAETAQTGEIKEAVSEQRLALWMQRPACSQSRPPTCRVEYDGSPGKAVCPSSRLPAAAIQLVHRAA